MGGGGGLSGAGAVCVSAGPGRFAVSVPVVVPEGQVVLRGGQLGGRVRVVR
ncbi:MAG: hypothetical protein AAGI45_22265 [Cyanobacteria bacterium P01_H01_bin.26]